MQCKALLPNAYEISLQIQLYNLSCPAIVTTGGGADFLFSWCSSCENAMEGKKKKKNKGITTALNPLTRKQIFTQQDIHTTLNSKCLREYMHSLYSTV